MRRTQNKLMNMEGFEGSKQLDVSLLYGRNAQEVEQFHIGPGFDSLPDTLSLQNIPAQGAGDKSLLE